MNFKAVDRVIELLTEKDTVIIRKASTGTQSFIASSILKEHGSVVVIFPDNSSLEEFVSLLRLFSPFEREGGWDRDWVVFKQFEMYKGWKQRWVNLFCLKEKKRIGIALTVDNLLPYFMPHKVLEEEYLYLAIGLEVSIEKILNECISWGYKRVEVVTEVGEIAVRGGVVDIFTATYDYPVRIEFFGETIDSIRLFETVTQRSKKSLEDVLILPVVPCVFKPMYCEKAKRKWEYLWKSGYISKEGKSILETLLMDQKLTVMPGMYYDNCVPLKEFLPHDCVFLLIGGDRLRDKLEEHLARFEQLLKRDVLGSDLPIEVCFQLINQARETWIGKRHIVFDNLPSGMYEKNCIDLEERQFFSYQDLLWVGSYIQRPYSSLVSSLKEWKNSYFQIILTFSSLNRREKFLKFLEDSGIEIETTYNPFKMGIFALISSFDKGIELKWNDTLIISEKILRLPSWKENSENKDFKGIRRIDEIRPGDFVVHRDYGIGKFIGLTHLTVDDLKNDFLEILYANNDRLFLPVDRLNLIQKFKAPDDVIPALDRLGSNKWSITKEKVRKALQRIAFDLVKMYAYRKIGKGFAFPPADDLYKEFEATFGFEETPDQERAIREVIRDMESSKPMDRLVCGDAGFGKTEVAMRAAFKAVCAGKQVLFLCPTTVLAEQHYRTFKERMKDFPVTIRMLSRFVPKNEQKKIINEASQGKVDILIGTHRLLSEDVKLTRLGLFIVDEEQRFGVSQKEKIKKMKKDVDVLTLTATPIPRTLQLSLSGVRDLSIIETPPPERKAVKSCFMTRDPIKLKEAIENELKRGGQVFWVYNKINGLKEVKNFVQSLVPEAKVAMAHGRMAEKSLEETMHRFWKGEIDVLVCTSIIESGLDFSNANTIIIDNAHMFGLGQLYQMRGRVGRSQRQGYAFFVVPDKKALSPLAEKRLQTVMNLDFLGAGFHVAMEDLRIRGAGNLLGEAQTGYISKVGLDMFLEILEKEIRRAKGEQVEEEMDTELNIKIPAHIPEYYISSHQERLSYYKILASCETEEEIENIFSEIKDRFGPLPDFLLNLKEVFLLKQILITLKVQKVDIYPAKIILTWGKEFPFDVQSFIKWVEDNKDYINLLPDSRVEFSHKVSNSNITDMLSKIRDILKRLEKYNLYPAFDNIKEVTSC